MNRLEWILGILLVVLLLVVIVFSLMLWFQPNLPTAAPANSATVIANRAVQPAPTSVFEGQTAMVAFAVAQQTAVTWQNDAVLLTASATWPQGSTPQMLLEGETTWGYTFYSPATQQTALISVVENKAQLVNESRTDDSLDLLAVSGWNIDSRDAIQTFLAEGGATFMSQQGTTALTMQLSTENEDGRIEWIVSLFAYQTRNSLTMHIDATSGDIVQRNDTNNIDS